MGKPDTTPDPGPTPDGHRYSVRPIDTDAAELRRWNDDLDVLAREVPATHANLFHTLDRQQFDEAIADIRRRLPTLARHQVIVELMRLAAAIGDGHTTVSPWRDPAGFHTLPVNLYRFADGYYVRTATTYGRPHETKLPCSVPALRMSAASPSIRQRNSSRH